MPVAFFYGPLTASQDGSNEQSRQNLRMQVRAFIAWLKKNGIIDEKK